MGVFAGGGEDWKMQPPQWDSNGFGSGEGPGEGCGPDTMPHERGSRRRKLAAMAGSVYRAGVAAATEIRDQYSNARARGLDASDVR